MTEPIAELPPPTIGYGSAALIDRDQEHLRILGICWYILSGCMALFGFFPLIYIATGIMFLSMPMAAGGPGGPPPAFLGYFMIIGGATGALTIWTGAALSFFTARSLNKRIRLMLCYATAGLACLSVPFGTAIGVCTFIVLARPSVRAGFPR